MSDNTECNGCKFAEWRRNKVGALHPDKSGRCTYLDKHPMDLSIPTAFYWSSWNNAPRPSGGFIERGKAHHNPCKFKAI